MSKMISTIIKIIITSRLSMMMITKIKMIR